jgi:hypothetical protein
MLQLLYAAARVLNILAAAFSSHTYSHTYYSIAQWPIVMNLLMYCWSLNVVE